MNKYYTKAPRRNYRRFFRILSISVSLLGTLSMLYVFFPLLLWQLYFAPVFASGAVAAPIPKTTVVNRYTIQSLFTQASDQLAGVDYGNAQNWFPTFKVTNTAYPKVNSYTLSIPKLRIKNANVTTVDNDLNSHLVNYGGTAIPPENGNAVVFGHSTLPQWFDPTNYKAIFATVHTLIPGDSIVITAANVTYTYKIFAITVVDPTDTSVLAQNYDNSYLTIVTCTPPGTTWKRLVIKSRIEKI